LRSERVCNVNSVGNQRATSEGGFGVLGLRERWGNNVDVDSLLEK